MRGCRGLAQPPTSIEDPDIVADGEPSSGPVLSLLDQGGVMLGPRGVGESTGLTRNGFGVAGGG